MQQYVTVKPLPFFYVGKQITTDRINRFTTNKHGLLSQALGKQDTQSIWYSKEHFQKLVEEIEFAEGDGVRVHFGMYEEGHEFQGQLCLLFNTTRAEVVDDITLHNNVVLEDEPNYEERSSLPREIILYPGEGCAGDIRDFNLGSPCPPRCDGPGKGDPNNP